MNKNWMSILLFYLPIIVIIDSFRKYIRVNTLLDLLIDCWLIMSHTSLWHWSTFITVQRLKMKSHKIRLYHKIIEWATVNLYYRGHLFLLDHDYHDLSGHDFHDPLLSYRLCRDHDRDHWNRKSLLIHLTSRRNNISTYQCLIDVADGDYASSHFQVDLHHSFCAILLPIIENLTIEMFLL